MNNANYVHILEGYCRPWWWWLNPWRAYLRCEQMHKNCLLFMQPTQADIEWSFALAGDSQAETNDD